VPAGITPGSAFENTFRSLSSEQQNAVISQMTADGVRWLRLDVTSTFSSDAFIQDATAGGIHVDAILQNGGLSNTPSAIASFASDAVAHLKPEGVETYEVLNEPNGCGDTETASGYAAILKSTYIAIKTADPNAFVLSGGLCPNSGANEPYTYLTSMYADGVQGYFDGFNMHPYSFPDTPLQVTDGWNPWSYLSELYSIMSSNGDGNKKIWLTEFGCPTGTDGGYPADCTDATLAQQITDAFTSARAGAYVGPLLIYNWEDDSVTQDGDFGLYTSSGSAKPDTLAAYMSEAAG
jgi:hypothetical protein